MRIIARIIVSIVEIIRHYYGRLYIMNLVRQLGSYEQSDISYPIMVKNPTNIHVSKGVKIGPYCTLGAFREIRIGYNSRISSNCIIETGTLNLGEFDYGKHKGECIIIGNNVWVGASCIILSGAIIGDNTFISAGSVVSGRVPANSIFKNGTSKTRNYE